MSTAAIDDTTAADTTAAPASASTSSASTTADPAPDASDTAGFITPVDGGDCSPDRCGLCDVWTQDCGPEQKCTPWSSDQDDLWDSFRCSPLAADPDHPGDPCSTEGTPASGRDSCDLESMCWGVDPDTLHGTCVRFCGGTADDPDCPDGTACMIAFAGAISLCLPTCDPLLQDCPGGAPCISTHLGEPGFVCVPAGPGEPGHLHDPCERVDACAPGLSCLNPVLAVECDLPGFGCCVPFCDLTMPDCVGFMQECQPWFGDTESPPGHEHVGFCGVPL